MIGTMRIQGADKSANNVSGSNYVPTLQATTGQRSKLHKAIVSNLSAATDAYLWVFDLATGSGSSVAPRVVMLCPAGVCSTLDLGDGKPFVNGIYCALATAAPATAASTPTAVANNIAILDVDYRLE